MPKPKNPVQLAVIGAAHGIKGEVRVKTFTAEPLALGDYGPLCAEDGRVFEVADIRPQGTVVVARFKGVNDRNAAEALTGTALFVDRSALPDELDHDEFYHADLIALEVKDDAGETIGRVTAVQNFGGGDILELALGGGQTALIPFTTAAVPQVSVSAGFIRIDPLAAGLVDSGEGAETEGGSGFDTAQRPRGSADAGGNR
jgi:16S rRNA processing protein RimM